MQTSRTDVKLVHLSEGKIMKLTDGNKHCLVLERVGLYIPFNMEIPVLPWYHYRLDGGNKPPSIHG